MSTSPLDRAPEDGLERAFQLPDKIKNDESLVALHAEIVERLRNEASGITMNTVQTLLLERIAYFYIELKWQEENALSGLGKSYQDSVTRWISYTEGFNKMLIASSDKLRERMMEDINKMLTDAVSTLPDKASQQTMLREMAAGFAKLGM